MATAATVFRNYETDGVPSSGAKKPKKSEIRQLLTGYESIINAFLSNGGLIFASRASLEADLAHGPNSMAWVIGDATVANDGIYRKIGASGVGSWTRVADLPFSFIIASDTGAGTPNAIQATTSIPVSSSALIWMNIFEANTASPVTVSFNGGTAITIKTNSGNDVAVGGLTAGMIVMGIVSGSTFRLVSDQASAAIVAAAEAAQAAAEVAQDAAEAAAAAAEGVGVAVAVWPSGTLRTMKARATDTYCILDAPGSPDPTGTNDSTTALLAMVAEGVRCEVTKGAFVCGQQLVLADGQEIIGFGGGYIFDAHSRILFTGTGTKSSAIPDTAPITVANPGAGEAYLADSGTRGNNYSTLDLRNNFSAGIILGKGSKLSGLGIFPTLNGGLADYSNGDNYDLSDEWDVGVWARNADGWEINNCFVAGHWRKSALLVSAHDIGDGKTPSNEKGYAVHSHFQGFRGVTIRSPNTGGGNYGFAGSDFFNCDFRPLNHQSAHLATSSMLDVPFSSPSACLEIGGGTMRGVQFLHSTFIGRDDICMIFDNASETLFNGCYEEAQNVRVSGSWMTNGQGSRMVATANSSSILLRNNTKYAIDFTPYQARDVGLSTGRYTANGVYNPANGDDDDYSVQGFASTMGPRLRSSSQAWRVLGYDNQDVLRANANGQVVAKLFDSGTTASVADDAAVDIVPLKKGGFCAITFTGGAEDSNFPSATHSGIFFYDVGTATFSATKLSGGANFVCVNTDLTGTTGTDGNVTIGVKDGTIRAENRQGSASVFRYTFFG